MFKITININLTQREIEHLYTKAYRVVTSCRTTEQLNSAENYITLFYKTLMNQESMDDRNRLYYLTLVDFLNNVVKAKQLRLEVNEVNNV